MKRKILTIILILSSLLALQAEDTTPIDMSSMTKEKVLNMSIEDFSNLPLETIMKLMDIAGVGSLEELYQMLLNKDVTSASKSEESLFDSPLSTTVLSYEEIIQSGATSIPEALRLVPGVIVREKTNGNYDVHLRGNDNLPAKNMMLYSENTNTLVMINNRPVFNYAHGGTLWETLPVGMEDIDRIEIVRGPSSALYGPNAVTGVINIMTKEINKTSSLISGTVQGGNLGTYKGDIALKKMLNSKFSFGLTSNYETRQRNTDKINIYNAPTGMIDDEIVGNGEYSKAQLKKIKKPSIYNSPLTPENNKYYYLFPEKGSTDLAVYDIRDIFEDPELATDKLGLNGYLSYQMTSTSSIHLTTGFQNSNSISTTFGDMPTPYSARKSNTSYIDLRATLNKLNVQANYNGGTTDFMLGNEGFKLDSKHITFSGDYDLKLGNLGIKPGVSYQLIGYDDSDYLSQKGRGYLNKEREISILSSSVRFDYSLFEKLRLIAALRAEKYNKPEDWYASWQLVSSYKINDNHILRAVYSRANQSAFLVNTYSDYQWNIINSDYPRVIHFGGDENHKLKSMDMFEIGYRVRPAKNILIDIEAFYQETENYGALLPEYTSLGVYPEVIKGIYDYAVYQGANQMDALTSALTNSPDQALPDSVSIIYQNLDLKSKQYGASISVDWIISQKLIAKAHFTWQQTILDNYLDYSRDNLILYQALHASPNNPNTAAELQAVGMQLLGGVPVENLPNVVVAESTSMPTDEYKNNYKHKATPSYWGSFGLTYKPMKKLDIFAQTYFYGEQTFVNQYGEIPVESKILLNAKVTYQVNSKLSLFLNGRNILNNETREFAYMDKIGALYLGGLHFKF